MTKKIRKRKNDRLGQNNNKLEKTRDARNKTTEDHETSQSTERNTQQQEH